MRRLLKYLFRILLLLGIGFVVYAAFGDLPPPQGESVVHLPAPAAGE